MRPPANVFRCFSCCYCNCNACYYITLNVGLLIMQLSNALVTIYLSVIGATLPSNNRRQIVARDAYAMAYPEAYSHHSPFSRRGRPIPTEGRPSGPGKSSKAQGVRMVCHTEPCWIQCVCNDDPSIGNYHRSIRCYPAIITERCQEECYYEPD